MFDHQFTETYNEEDIKYISKLAGHYPARDFPVLLTSLAEEVETPPPPGECQVVTCHHHLSELVTCHHHLSEILILTENITGQLAGTETGT